MTTYVPATSRTTIRWLLFILAVAAVLRLGYVLAQDFDAYYTTGGGDTVWYLENGYTLVTGDDPSGKHDISRLPTAPLYLIMIGLWQVILAPTSAIVAILLTQVAMSTAVVFFAYGLAQRLMQDTRAGLLAAGVLAISPAFILETGQILTETLYIFLVMAGLWWYATRATQSSSFRTGQRVRPVVITGLLLGLAALTRAVLLLFPFGLALHLIILGRDWKTGLQRALVLVLAFSFVISTWTVYNLARWHRFVIVAEGFSSFLYVGSRGWDDPDEVDRMLREDIDNPGTTDTEDLKQSNVFLRAARRVIASDPLGYARHRASELASAYLQPHGTVIIGGDSLKDRAQWWITENRTWRGLSDLVREEAFWPKLALYVFHFGGLLLGCTGVWLTRRSTATVLPLAGLILYTTLIHMVMLALPRYLFPLYPIWWVFAAAAILTFWDRWRGVHSVASGSNS